MSSTYPMQECLAFDQIYSRISLLHPPQSRQMFIRISLLHLPQSRTRQ